MTDEIPPRAPRPRPESSEPSDRARLGGHPELIGPEDTATTTVYIPFPRADQLLAEGSDGHTYLGAGVVLRDTLHHWGYSLERILDFERRSEDHEWAVEAEVSVDV